MGFGAGRRQLGLSEVPAVRLTDLSEAELRMLRLALNRFETSEAALLPCESALNTYCVENCFTSSSVPACHSAACMDDRAGRTGLIFRHGRLAQPNLQIPITATPPTRPTHPKERARDHRCPPRRLAPRRRCRGFVARPRKPATPAGCRTVDNSPPVSLPVGEHGTLRHEALFKEAPQRDRQFTRNRNDHDPSDTPALP